MKLVFKIDKSETYEFVAVGIGVIKSAEISQNSPLVCRCQYSSEFFATSIGQVCRCRYVAPELVATMRAPTCTKLGVRANRK